MIFWGRDPFKCKAGADGPPIGILAGGGDLPERVAAAIQRRGCKVLTLAVGRPDDDPLKISSVRYETTGPQEVGRAIEILKESRVKYLALAGKMPRTRLLADSYRPDTDAKTILRRAGAGGDDRLLKAVAAYLRLRGITVLGLHEILREHVTPRGPIGTPGLTAEEMKDARFGLQMARRIGRLDIGQAVIVKNGTVIAVEAVEGTDRAIRRIESLGVTGAVVVKAAKPQQDLRFDIPVVGPDTLESCRAAACSVLACEAGRTLLVDPNEMARMAGKYGIKLVGVAS
ncbi:MAG: UDP-2,3-diacylglucosamine diphosphatase LpxI [Candidatus Omnitrophica bacterium]|nr:UDP-2,3-diacylglucosamine diphosphatase LpxI [Candidatus Omnitrophota bacterium]